jgi:hypothetical protein
MNKLPPTALLLAALLGLSQCSKKDDPDPVSQLPPATQTGANTFGCLVNGQPWTPKGYNGTGNYSVAYDPTYRNGTLSVGTYRYIGSGDDDYQTVGFFSDSLRGIGNFPLTIIGHQEGIFVDHTTNCEFSSNGSHYRRGTLTITRLDLQAGIISGTFAFTLYKPGCDSVRVTQGRFDKRL